jgi:hypothetical protein
MLVDRECNFNPGTAVRCVSRLVSVSISSNLCIADDQAGQPKFQASRLCGNGIAPGLDPSRTSRCRCFAFQLGALYLLMNVF